MTFACPSGNSSLRSWSPAPQARPTRGSLPGILRGTGFACAAPPCGLLQHPEPRRCFFLGRLFGTRSAGDGGINDNHGKEIIRNGSSPRYFGHRNIHSVSGNLRTGPGSGTAPCRGGCTVVCGGRGGVMEGVCRGVPNGAEYLSAFFRRYREANPYVTIPCRRAWGKCGISPWPPPEKLSYPSEALSAPFQR